MATLSSSRFAWLLFGVFSLAAVAAGCVVVGAYMNLAAWAVGLVLAVLISRTRFEGWWPVLALAGLVVTFVFDGMQGVHRWIVLGPVRVNAAELLLPATVVALAFDKRPLRLAIAALIPLALQPDASQAIAFAGGAIAILTMSEERFLSAAFVAVLAALSFLKPDPLAPVPEVEGIVGLASPALAMLAMFALAGASVAPLAATRSAAASGLTAYLVLAALAPMFGAFPVPLVGMGMSAILGTWLGFGALMGVTRRRS